MSLWWMDGGWYGDSLVSRVIENRHTDTQTHNGRQTKVKESYGAFCTHKSTKALGNIRHIHERHNTYISKVFDVKSILSGFENIRHIIPHS